MPRPCLGCSRLIATGSRCAACAIPRPDGRTRQAQRAATIQRDGHHCAHCGNPPTLLNPLELHHVLPLADGGTDHPDNLRLLCRHCHGTQHKGGAQIAGSTAGAHAPRRPRAPTFRAGGG